MANPTIFLPEVLSPIPAHNIFTFDNNIIFSSNFDNGNLARVERIPNRPYEFKIWSAYDNMGTPHQSKHCAWFHFVVTGLPLGCVIRIQVANASNHAGLYKHDMRPVYRSNMTNQKWTRVKTSVRFMKDNETPQLFFEHSVDCENDKLYFAFTYPYSYTQLQQELEQYDTSHRNNLQEEGSIYYKRELLTNSGDGRRVDLITISSVDGIAQGQYEPLLSGLFPDNLNKPQERCPVFAGKEVVFVSARVHPGEVPAQHTFKGILQLLMDKDDLCGQALRARYVFKLIPMLNPDGVYRGHFRMDEQGHNLNRYYTSPDPSSQPAIYAAKTLLDYYAKQNTLSLYLDFHAHASKRGCFIYGNVLDSIEDQVQNQLFCKLISLNTPHFDYEGCLFSKEHMFRIDPGDQAKGLTAEGSGRVNTYLAYGLIHSYTIECNYNTSRIGNEVPPPEQEIGGQAVTPASPFTTNPEKYTPAIYAGVGRACIIAFLDMKGHNPCSRIPKSKFKSLDRVRNAVIMEVRSRKEYFGKKMDKERRRSSQERRVVNSSPLACSETEFIWRRVIDKEDPQSVSGSASGLLNPPLSARSAHSNERQGHYVPSSEILFISASDQTRTAKRRSASVTSTSDPPPVKSTLQESSHQKYILSAPSSPGKISNSKRIASGKGSGSGKALLNSGDESPRLSFHVGSFDSNDGEYYEQVGGKERKIQPQKSTRVRKDDNQFQFSLPGSPRNGRANNTRRSETQQNQPVDSGSDKSSSPSSLIERSNREDHRILQSNSEKTTHLVPSLVLKNQLGGIAFVESVEDIMTGQINVSSPRQLKGNYRPDSHDESITSSKSLPENSSPSTSNNLVLPAPITNNNNNNNNNPPIHQNGTSMRDLIKEHSLNKMLKLSSNPMIPVTGLNNHSNGATANNHSTNNSAIVPSIPSTTPSSTRRNHKDNRKILGKTLHAAGVALLINGTTSSNPPSKQSVNNNTNPSNNTDIAVDVTKHLNIASGSTENDHNNHNNLHHGRSSSSSLFIPTEVSTIPRPPSGVRRVNLDSPTRTSAMNDLVITGNNVRSRPSTPNSNSLGNISNDSLEMSH